MNFFSPSHPVWLAGFRPFFILAAITGITFPVLWGLVFSGGLSLPAGVNPIQWHAHEMFFGFGGAVLFGFLLTASKNWVGVRGIHGVGLMALVTLWLIERCIIYGTIPLHPIVTHIGLSLFTVICGAYIIWTLLRNREKDSFRDNYFFVILLILIVLAKNLLISDKYYSHGVSMTVGLFRLAFVVMFERTMTQFMKSTEGINLYRNSILDLSIKAFVAICIFQSWFPTALGSMLLAVAAGLLLLRWLIWKPHRGFQKFGNATMYLGYLGIVLHLIFELLKSKEVWSHATFSLHVFTFLCMGIVIPSMMIRISKGHTGRKPEFLGWDKVIIFSIIIAALFRLVLPLLWPEMYTKWISMAGLMWAVAFTILFIKVFPFLIRPRIDGKIH